MKHAELAKKSDAELKKQLDTAIFDLMKYNAQVATGGIGKDAGKIRELRRLIARIHTIKTKTRR